MTFFRKKLKERYRTSISVCLILRLCSQKYMIDLQKQMNLIKFAVLNAKRL